jgi:integrase
MNDYPIWKFDDIRRIPWNKGRLIGQKLPLKPREIWAIRVRLQILRRIRDLALFNLAIDSKLRGCDLVRLRIGDVTQGGKVLNRAMVMQRKTGQPVKFEISEQTREAVDAWIKKNELKAEGYLFPSRFH